ncbi:OLC1v1020069C1 [Oldenlandia corymbosa var. corymbosa]|uniref:OLC1v1020069C1 n=1 Tax=Oldenlandia corymbosa var. corymbosa TaxID=529605 RepID=A0AAV1EFF8_OLDCO|nr:OLC1v1020069C1 [Oldenlandia corymbosa var. corymbosa]
MSIRPPTVKRFDEFYQPRCLNLEGVEGLICCRNTAWNPTTQKKFDLPTQYLRSSTMVLPLRRGIVDWETQFQIQVINVVGNGDNENNSWRDITHLVHQQRRVKPPPWMEEDQYLQDFLQEDGGGYKVLKVDDDGGNKLIVLHPKGGHFEDGGYGNEYGCEEPMPDCFNVEGIEGLIQFCEDPATNGEECNLPNPCFSINTMDFPVGWKTNEVEFENAYYLGYDTFTEKYKVLSVCVADSMCEKYLGEKVHLEGKFQMQVINLGSDDDYSGSWRDITHHVPDEAKTEGMTVFLYPNNPSLYFKNEIYILFRFPGYDAVMIFSVGEETFRFVQLPEELELIKEEKRVMIEVRECVALMKMKKNRSKGTEIWRLVTSPDQSEDREKIIVPTWPEFVHQESDKSEVLEHVVGCAINDRENLVQLRDKMQKRTYCSYWDIKEGIFRKAPRLELTGDMYGDIYFKHVETLFDPTAKAKSSQGMVGAEVM